MNKITGLVKFIGMPVYSHQYGDVNFYVMQAESLVTRNNTPTTVRVRVCLPESIVIEQNIVPVTKTYQITGRLINSWVKFHEDLSIVLDEISEVLLSSEEEFDEKMINSLTVTISGQVSRITTTPENMKSFFGFMATTTDEETDNIVTSRILTRGALMKYVSKEVKVGQYAVIKGYLTNLFNKSDGALLTEITAYAVQLKDHRNTVRLNAQNDARVDLDEIESQLSFDDLTGQNTSPTTDDNLTSNEEIVDETENSENSDISLITDDLKEVDN